MNNKIYPFKFLDSYTAEDKDIFFGRDEEIDQLYQMIYQSDILLLYGASGTGKTSLIQCGLASKFQKHDWLEVFVRRHKNLNESLQKSLITIGGKNEESKLRIRIAALITLSCNAAAMNLSYIQFNRTLNLELRVRSYLHHLFYVNNDVAMLLLHSLPCHDFPEFKS